MASSIHCFYCFPSRKLFRCKLQEKVPFFLEGNKGNQCLSVKSIVNIMSNFCHKIINIITHIDNKVSYLKGQLLFKNNIFVGCPASPCLFLNFSGTYSASFSFFSITRDDSWLMRILSDFIFSYHLLNLSVQVLIKN